MKWYKHFSSMRFDAKVKRLINKYGIEGYGLYNYILECIAFNLDSNKPIPEIEESANDIAIEVKMDTVRVEEIIQFCVQEKLFEINPETKRIMCLKILNHLDNTLSNNPEIKNILRNFKELQENLIPLKQIRLDKIRLDKIIKEEGKPKHIKNIIPPTIGMVTVYCNERKNNVNPVKFINHYDSNGWKVGKNKMIDWQASIRTWEKSDFDTAKKQKQSVFEKHYDGIQEILKNGEMSKHQFEENNG